MRGQHWQSRRPAPVQAQQHSPQDTTGMDTSLPQLSNNEDMQAASGADSASESLLQVQSSLTAAAEQADQIRMGSAASLSGSPDQAAQPKQAATPSSTHVKSEERIVGSTAADAAAADGVNTQRVQPEMPGVTDSIYMIAQTALPRQHGVSLSSSPLGSAPQEEQMPSPDATAVNESQAELATASAADVTMMTRSAFDSVNSMFQGALPQANAWPQNATSRLAQPRLALAGPVTARLLGSDAAAPARQTSFLGPEPTVTLSTQAAFSTLNDMFRADLPHQAPRGSAASTAVHPAASGQSLQRRSHSAEGFPVWEDTQLLPSIMEQGSPAAPAVSNSPAIPMYEDTQFLAGPKDVPHSRQTAGDPEMQLYEDTQFMQENAAAALTAPRSRQPVQASLAGLHIYEGARGMQEDGAAPAAASPGFQLYEDTQFITAPAGAAAGRAHAPRQHWGLARSPAMGSLRAPPSPRGHEGHTALLAENVRPPSPAVPAGHEAFNSPTKNKVRSSSPCMLHRL